MVSSARARPILLLLLVLSATAGPLLGQARGTLIGRVLDRTTGQPLAGAQLILVRDSRSFATDSLGHYRVNDIPLGTSQVLVRAPLFPAETLSVQFDWAGEQVLTVLMDSTAAGRAAQQLPAVGITAAAPTFNYRLASFERRRASGRGQYLTEDDIMRTGAFNVPDALKGMRGVTYECGGGAGCYIRMSRAPMRCLPEYIVDEQLMNDFGPLTPIRDIIAIEVYTGPADVPGEYAGRNAGCGVIVIYTRSGPRAPPRRPG